MPLGLYISVPFCRSKCSYCNFASDVFSRTLFERYVSRVCADIENAAQIALPMGGHLERAVDTIYIGGGTPTILDVELLKRLFVTISRNFAVAPGAEITVECAPGTLTDAMIEAFEGGGVNRVSLGVQSFVDLESRAVGRLHTQALVRDDIRGLRAGGITNINVDLLAGLPHQTAQSWRQSLDAVVDTGVPHVSMYMLEVDEESRLGRELIAGGTRYHAHFVPDEDLIADLYGMASERLASSGVWQYEISNFARRGFESRHNLKYWTRQPYLGFGVDAHSMLYCGAGNREERDTTPGNESTFCDGPEAIRFSTPDSLASFLAETPPEFVPVSQPAALEESLFLGLRLNRGVELREIEQRFGKASMALIEEDIGELVVAGLLEKSTTRIRLTPRGRLLSNEVFARFVLCPQA